MKEVNGLFYFEDKASDPRAGYCVVARSQFSAARFVQVHLGRVIKRAAVEQLPESMARLLRVEAQKEGTVFVVTWGPDKR